MRCLFSLLFLQILLLPVHTHAAEPAHDGHTVKYYQCSMHPWITSDKPESCPVCGMNLTAVHEGAAGKISFGRAAIELSPERRQLIGVTHEKAAVRPLVYSVHSVGHVAYNPDIAAAYAEYREAYGAWRKVRGTPNERIREQAMQLMEIAELKLKLAGMSSEQMEKVKEASFDTRVLKGFFAPTGLILPEGHIWVDTDLYESDSEMVKAGDQVSMTSPALPGQIFSGAVRFAEPVLNEFPRKLRVRVETEHSGNLKAGMAVDLRIRVDLGKKLAVPEAALLESGHTQLVFVDMEDGKIEPREVQAGQRADGYYEIVAGLHEGENVITSAAFLIDSESRLRAAAQGFSSQNTEAAPAGGHRH